MPTIFVQDFEKHGVFDAQNALEKVHKEEEDALYQEIFEDRKQQVSRISYIIILGYDMRILDE